MDIRALGLAAALAVAVPFTATAATVELDDVDVTAAALGAGATGSLAPFTTTTIEIDEVAPAGADSARFLLTAFPSVKSTISASLNENPFVTGTGFLGATVTVSADNDNDGIFETVLASLSGAALASGIPVAFFVPGTDTVEVLASWTSVAGPFKGATENFDIFIQSVPLPASLVLFLTALAGTGVVARRKSA